MPSAYRDGESYDRISAPLERIGREVIARLELAGDETVLDAGAGPGGSRRPWSSGCRGAT
jgi:hypothetical protein